MNTQEQENFYYGSRGEDFRSLIISVLQRGKLKLEVISSLTDNKGMALYSQAFTHDSVNPQKNYEYFETLGDATVNKAIVWYLSRRYPQLNCPEGVKIISRLKINLVSKKTFSSFGERLGFWDFISASNEIRSSEKKKTLEDVFEAFFAVTELLIDTRIKLGAGYAICYNIVKSLFDEIEISLKYEDLFDPKTRLKELFDYYRELGKIDYVAEREGQISYVEVYQVKRGQRIFLGKGSAALKVDAEQNASIKAIEKLNALGYIKEAPSEYNLFCKFN